MSTLKEKLKKIIDTEDDVEELRKKLNDLLDEKKDIPKAKPGKSFKYRKEALNVLCGVFTAYTIKLVEQIFAQNDYDFTATYLYLEKTNNLPKRGRRHKNVFNVSDEDLQKECDNLKCSYTKDSSSRNEDWQQYFKESPKPEQEKQRQSKPYTNNSPMSYYVMLNFMGLTELHNRADLDRAYRVKARVLHPDKGGTSEQFIQLTKIYESLKTMI